MFRFGFFVLALIALPSTYSLQAGDNKATHLLIVPPTGGKDVKLVDWRFTLGTRRLDLEGKSKKPAGPQYLEFREDKSTTYKNGIFTFIPLTSIRTIDYDRAKKAVTLVTLNDAGMETTLTGSTKFVNNKVTIEAEAVLEGLGNATVTFQGGTDKGLQRITFPAPKPAAKVMGLPAVITADDKEKTKHTAHDVQPLYLVNGNYRILPYLMFKKTVKIDLDKIAAIRFVPPLDKKKVSTDYEVTLKDGATHTLHILTAIPGDKKKAAILVGLIGRVPVGYKVFMLDAISEYRAATEKK